MKRIDTAVAIIGGGLIGCAAALFLRKFGIEVVLLERGACGARASGVNFGGVRRQGRAPVQLPLAMRAHHIWASLPELIGTDGEYVRSGHLKLARSRHDLESLIAYRDSVSDFDLQLEIIEGADFRRRFPGFGASVVGASLCPEDGQANPRLVAPAFAGAARAAGARLLEHHHVIGIVASGGGFRIQTDRDCEVRSDILVNAAGAWGHELANILGEFLPQSAGYPTMAVTEPLPAVVSCSLGVEGGGFYARQAVRGNVVMGGGFGETIDADLRSRPGRVAMRRIACQAADILPALAHANIIRFWSGVEGYALDKQPYLGPSSAVSGLIHAFGFSGAGFQISPAVGLSIAEWVATGHSFYLHEAFSPDRFKALSNLSGRPT